ncbi:MAG TPA: oligosaccharide flippase family protein [Candidatus Latescibacteria bacterium]|nr:oligosaccharide flippase family protein [Candidatus Latescibacterota bacterium]
MGVLKNYSIYAVGSIAQSAASALLFPFYLVFLSSTEFGAIALITVVSEFLLLFSALGLETGLNRLYYESKERQNDLVVSVLLLRVGLAGVVLAAAFVAPGRVSHAILGTEEYAQSIPLVAGYVLAHGVLGTMLFTYRLEQRATAFVVYSLLAAVIGCGLKVLFIGVYRLGVEGYWIAALATDVVLVVPMLLEGSSRFLRGRPVWRFLREMLAIGFPMTFAALGGIAVNMSGQYALNRFAGTELVGIYAAATRIASMFAMLLSYPIAAWWGPHVLSEAEKEGPVRLQGLLANYLRVLVAVGIVLLGVISLGGAVVVWFPIHESYRSAVPLVGLCILPLLVQVVSYPFTTQFIYAKRTHYFAAGGVLSAAVAIVLNATVTPYWGINGVILSTLAAACAATVLYYFGGQREFPVPYEWKPLWLNGALVTGYTACVVGVLYRGSDAGTNLVLVAALALSSVALVANRRVWNMFTWRISNFISEKRHTGGGPWS